MYTRIASRAATPAVREIGKVITENMNRLFATAQNIPAPHSGEYIKLQQKLFKIQNIPAEVTKLPEGTTLIGLNVTASEPHFLGAGPVYHPEILKSISPHEKQHWQEMAKEYYAQVGKYELLCDINCVTVRSENGVPLHYIDHGLLEAKSYTPLEKLFNLDAPTSKL